MLMRVTVNLVHFLCVSRCTALPFFFFAGGKGVEKPERREQLDTAHSHATCEGRPSRDRSVGGAPTSCLSFNFDIYIYF